MGVRLSGTKGWHNGSTPALPVNRFALACFFKGSGSTLQRIAGASFGASYPTAIEIETNNALHVVIGSNAIATGLSASGTQWMFAGYEMDWTTGTFVGSAVAGYVGGGLVSIAPTLSTAPSSALSSINVGASLTDADLASGTTLGPVRIWSSDHRFTVADFAAEMARLSPAQAAGLYASWEADSLGASNNELLDRGPLALELTNLSTAILGEQPPVPQTLRPLDRRLVVPRSEVAYSFLSAAPITTASPPGATAMARPGTPRSLFDVSAATSTARPGTAVPAVITAVTGEHAAAVPGHPTLVGLTVVVDVLGEIATARPGSGHGVVGVTGAHPSSRVGVAAPVARGVGAQVHPRVGTVSLPYALGETSTSRPGVPTIVPVINGEHSVARPGVTLARALSILNFSPDLSLELPPDAPVMFDVIAQGATLMEIVVVAKFDNGSPWECVFDGSAFGSNYSTLSTLASIANGLRFRVRRDQGWPTSPALEILVFDSGGDEASKSATWAA